MELPIDAHLLDTSRGDLTPTSFFNASLNEHGRYDGMRCVIRLSPRVHDLVASLPDGIGFRSDVSWDQVQAFSTYLHETVHWWQHVGSTCGLMLSLSYPAQTHSNINHLRHFAKTIGPRKSILEYAATAPGPRGSGTPAGLANTIINNQFDINAYRLLATNPERAEPLVNHKMFESVGHAYQIALAQVLNAIGSTFDRTLAFLPDFREWEQPFRRLRQDRVPGYFHGSPVALSPIGAGFIFEGQARYGQLQYLHFSSNGRFNFKDAYDAGMMDELYTEAFETFLRLVGLDRPDTIDHPTVGLFLLICDIANNPGEGFPLPIQSFATFLSDVDPGLRFIQLCSGVRLFCPDLATAITDYSFEEYEAASERLCAVLKTYSPMAICREVSRWCEENQPFRDNLILHDSGKSSELNPPIQLLFGQFASFIRDKIKFAHILCWPGAHMAGTRATDNSIGIFSRQSPLFIDRAEDEMIVPVLKAGLIEADVMESFQRFYDSYALYELTTQWIIAPGSFTYPFRWLQPNGSDTQVKEWADRIFENAYGVAPDDFTILRT